METENRISLDSGYEIVDSETEETQTDTPSDQNIGRHNQGFNDEDEVIYDQLPGFMNNANRYEGLQVEEGDGRYEVITEKKEEGDKKSACGNGEKCCTCLSQIPCWVWVIAGLIICSTIIMVVTVTVVLKGKHYHSYPIRSI